ncbi:hypothetical protein BTJ39_19075 [Izhakiella australiensis]|uniref:Uncharacterized protein n=1 Tax=Izhakiella australiensis TaxID=1926881 RepID=A0A1S8YH66_9GAMM|nr:hypothetical protein BTJ39_19075 [Izhakiella australiensis]
MMTSRLLISLKKNFFKDDLTHLINNLLTSKLFIGKFILNNSQNILSGNLTWGDDYPIRPTG